MRGRSRGPWRWAAALAAALAAPACASPGPAPDARHVVKVLPPRPAGNAAVAEALEVLADGPDGELRARRVLHAAVEGAEGSMLAAAALLPPSDDDRRVLLAAALARGDAAEGFPWEERVAAWLRDIVRDPAPRTRALLACARLRAALPGALPALRRAAVADTPDGAAASRVLETMGGADGAEPRP